MTPVRSKSNLGYMIYYYSSTEMMNSKDYDLFIVHIYYESNSDSFIHKDLNHCLLSILIHFFSCDCSISVMIKHYSSTLSIQYVAS